MKISIVCILNNDENLIPLILENFKLLEYPEENLEYIILDCGANNNIEHFIHNENYNYIHLDHKDVMKYFEKININNDENNMKKIYHTITQQLPIGFLRDYAVGMTSGDFIFHGKN